jgi:hypothetical protein
VSPVVTRRDVSSSTPQYPPGRHDFGSIRLGTRRAKAACASCRRKNYVAMPQRLILVRIVDLKMYNVCSRRSSEESKLAEEFSGMEVMFCSGA